MAPCLVVAICLGGMCVGCTAAPVGLPCMSVGQSDLVTQAASFRVDVFDNVASCDALGATLPSDSRVFAGGHSITLQVSPGAHLVVLSTYADPAQTTLTGRGCRSLEATAGANVCLDLAVLPVDNFDAGVDGGLDGGVDSGADAGSVNLVPNPGFEANLSQWDSTYGMLTRVADAHSGMWSAQLCYKPSGPYYTLQSQTLPVASITPNATYRASAWVKLSSTSRVSAFIILREYAGGTPYQAQGDSLPMSGWQLLSATLTTVAVAGNTLDVYVALNPPSSGALSTDCIEVDDVAVYAP